MKTVRMFAAALVLLAFAGFGVAEEKIDKEKLVGKWEPTKKAGVVIEMTKDGKLFITGNADGKEFKMEGTYTFADGKLKVSYKSPDGSDRKATLTVKSVTAEKLVTVDEKDREEELKRVK